MSVQRLAQERGSLAESDQISRANRADGMPPLGAAIRLGGKEVVELAHLATAMAKADCVIALHPHKIAAVLRSKPIEGGHFCW